MAALQECTLSPTSQAKTLPESFFFSTLKRNSRTTLVDGLSISCFPRYFWPGKPNYIEILVIYNIFHYLVSFYGLIIWLHFNNVHQLYERKLSLKSLFSIMKINSKTATPNPSLLLACRWLNHLILFQGRWRANPERPTPFFLSVDGATRLFLKVFCSSRAK